MGKCINAANIENNNLGLKLYEQPISAWLAPLMGLTYKQYADRLDFGTNVIKDDIIVQRTNVVLRVVIF